MNNLDEKQIEENLLSLSNREDDKDYFYQKTGVKLIDNQVSLEGGVVDFIGQDDNGNSIMVELKGKNVTYHVVGQVLKYLGNLDQRAIIVGLGFNKSYFHALEHFDNIDSYLYRHGGTKDLLTEVTEPTRQPELGSNNSTSTDQQDVDLDVDEAIEKLEEIRLVEKHLPIGEFAQNELGISRQSYSAWRNNKRKPKRQNKQKIKEYLEG